MPLDPTSFLRCVSDKFTQVRSSDGRLLGCVPLIGDGVEGLRGSDGSAFHAQIGAAVMLVCDLRTQVPSALPGFTPLDDRDADLAVPVSTEADLAEGV